MSGSKEVYSTSSKPLPPLEQLEQRVNEKGLDPIALFTAECILKAYAEGLHFQRSWKSARGVVAKQFGLPADFLQINHHNSGRFYKESVSFKLGRKVAMEILGLNLGY